MREKIKIFKHIKNLDAEIRTMEKPDDKDKEENYFIVEVGLYESLGEQGEILTLLYDNQPTEEEIIKEVRENLKETKKDLSNSLLTAREEGYLEILNKLVI